MQVQPLANIHWERPKIFKLILTEKPLWHWSQTQFLEGHSSAQFSSNPNQTHLIQLIKLFRITRNLQAGVIWSWLDQNCTELWPSMNWVWDHCFIMIEINRSYFFLPFIFEWMEMPPPDTVSSSLTVHAEHSSEQHKHPKLSYKSTWESFRGKSLHDTTVALQTWQRMKFQMLETVHRVLFGYRNLLSIIRLYQGKDYKLYLNISTLVFWLIPNFNLRRRLKRSVTGSDLVYQILDLFVIICHLTPLWCIYIPWLFLILLTV